MRPVDRVNGALKIATVFALAACVWITSGEAYAQEGPVLRPYQGADDWAQLPDGRTWGSPGAIEMDPDQKSLWVFERCGANSCAASDLPAILKFDSSGTLVQSFGAGMFNFPHGLHIDRNGNVWVSDAAGPDDRRHREVPEARGKGHQVVKFSPEGEILLVLGSPGVPGNPPTALTQPTDVVTAPNGDIFVAEGHGTGVARVSKFAPDGTFIKSWGSLGAEPGELRGPHNITLDSQGRLFVADRGNQRIQIFDQDGGFIDAWTQFGSPSGMFITPDDMLYVADLGAGIRIGSAKDGSLSAFIKARTPDSGSVRVAESVAVDAQGNVYAGENAERKIRKFVTPR